MPKLTPIDLSRMKAEKDVARDMQESVRKRQEDLTRQTLLREQAQQRPGNLPVSYYLSLCIIRTILIFEDRTTAAATSTTSTTSTAIVWVASTTAATTTTTTTSTTTTTASASQSNPKTFYDPPWAG